MDTAVQHILKDSEGIKDLPILYRQLVDHLKDIQERSWSESPRPTGRQAASIEWPEYIWDTIALVVRFFSPHTHPCLSTIPPCHIRAHIQVVV